MEPEKQRVLVLNKQYLLETEKNGQWITQSVVSAPSNMKPGIYLLNTAKSPQDSAKYEGQIVHKNEHYVFQKAKQSIVKFPCSAFSSLPSIGEVVSISLKDGTATLDNVMKSKKTIKR